MVVVVLGPARCPPCSPKMLASCFERAAGPEHGASTDLSTAQVRVCLLIFPRAALSWAADGGRAQRRRRARCRSATACRDKRAMAWAPEQRARLRRPSSPGGQRHRLCTRPGFGKSRSHSCGSHTPGCWAAGPGGEDTVTTLSRPHGLAARDHLGPHTPPATG